MKKVICLAIIGASLLSIHAEENDLLGKWIFVPVRFGPADTSADEIRPEEMPTYYSEIEFIDFQDGHSGIARVTESDGNSFMAVFETSSRKVVFLSPDHRVARPILSFYSCRFIFLTVEKQELIFRFYQRDEGHPILTTILLDIRTIPTASGAAFNWNMQATFEFRRADGNDVFLDHVLQDETTDSSSNNYGK